MKNFLHKEDYAPVCLIFRKYGDLSTTLQLYPNKSKKQQYQHNFAVLLSLMRFVFFLCHSHILYRNKIKSPE